MAKRTRKPTWLDVAVRNVGIRRAVRALDWAYSWAVVREAMDGQEPTAEQVAEWWGQPVRTAYRDQAEFRAAFPTLENPGVMYASEEARATVAKHADFGKRLDDWGQERRRRKQESSISVAQLPATH